jgi:hypothetical protein
MKPNLLRLANSRPARTLRGLFHRRPSGIRTPPEARGNRREGDEAEEGSPTVFFVVGSGKSGTTWLQRLFNFHPEILCRGEGRFFGREWQREDLREARAPVPPRSLYGAMYNSEDLRLWIGRSVWGGEDELDDHLDNLSSMAIDYFLKQKLAESGKRIVGDKTPFLPDTDILEEIARLCPGAKVIHIIRDGRDVQVSWTHHRWNRAQDRGGIQVLRPGEAERRESYHRDPRSIRDIGMFDEEVLQKEAAEWRDSVRRAREKGPKLLGDNYTEVRYEDLLGDTLGELRRLLEFLGARSNIRVLRLCVNRAKFDNMSGGRERGEEDPAAFLRKGVAGDWKNVFSEREKQIFKEEAGGLLVELGYEANHDW